MLVLAKVHFEVIKPVLECFHDFAALGALAGGGRGAEHQAALFVVAKIENFILKLHQVLAREPHPFAGRTDFHLDPIALLLHQFGIAIWALHGGSRRSI
jgi:hypothetical protein